MSENNKRNIGIDIIRGICVLAVILLHLNINLTYTNTFLKQVLPKSLFNNLFWNGYYGVVIFFTLSGYLITKSIYKKSNKLSKINIRQFYWYRFARIVPLLTLVLVVLSILHIVGIEGFYINPEQTSLTRALFSAFALHVNWLEIQVGYLPANWDVLWSISIEETFYLFFPLVCILLRHDWKFSYVLFFLLLISPWARTQLFIGNEIADRNHLAYLDSIALGCMSAIIAVNTHLSWFFKKFCLVLGLALIGIVLNFRGLLYHTGITGLGLNVSLLSVGIALLLLFLDENTFKGHKSLRWIEQMGKYSYEIYLTHMFVIVFGAQLFKSLDLNDNLLIPFSLLLIALCFLLGKLLYHYFSELMNQVLRSKYQDNK